MTIELLRELASTRLPATYRDEATVDRIRLLRAADYLAAVTSPPRAEAPFATVLCLTTSGRALLKSKAAQTSTARTTQ
jgi:hypothetical protein